MDGLIGDLSLRELRRRLTGPGLIIDSGAVVTKVFSPLKETVDAVRQAYGRYPLAADSLLPHFHTSVNHGGGLHRVFRRQAIAELMTPAPITPLPARMAPLVLEMALNWCVAAQAHWYLIFHAAVVERNGYGLVISGDTGQGKSTLCAGLVSSGWRLLSDEFGLFDLETRQLFPNVRPVSLKNESIKVMAERLPDNSLTPQLDDTPKGSIAYMPANADAIARRHEPAPPAAVIFPHYRPDASPSRTKVSKARAFISLTGGAANYEMQGEPAFEAMAVFVDQYPVYRIDFANLDDALHLVSEIESEVTAA